MHILKLLLLIVSVTLSACTYDHIYDSSNESPLADDAIECEPILIDQEDYRSAPNDDFDLNDIIIDGDDIFLKVSYGGGCGEEEFYLITDGQFMESNPVILNIKLAFDDDDHCEAYLSENLCYDLAKLKEHYQDSYQTSSGTIKLRFYEQDKIVRYTF